MIRYVENEGGGGVKIRYILVNEIPFSYRRFEFRFCIF